MNIVEYAKMRKMFGGGGGSGGGDIDALIDGSLTEITSNAESVRRGAFYYADKLETITLPSAKSIDVQAFNNCSNLITVNIPLATSIGSNSFGDCVKLTEVKAPLVTSISANVFYNCKVLKTADFSSVTRIDNYVFYQCYSLTALILRSETMCTLANTLAFNGCYHFQGTANVIYNPDGLKDGYIYVPRALIEDYKVATNWVTFADQFRALEDYTVDGTTTGELDESKVSL